MDLAPEAAEPLISRYEVICPLASGGMAEILLARTGGSDRLVVLKKLHPRLSIEAQYVQMFHDEAVIASKLHHPNLVEVYELGLHDDQPYIAMEHLHGQDLSRTLRRLRQRKLPLTYQQAILIARDVAAGLHHAHEQVADDGAPLGIIHRDVSPHNVVLTYAGEVKVVDFGVAKAASQIARTRTGVLKGKTAYMSPEQAMGDPLDRRTDVFSIGILLWELTTGRWLFRRKSELEMLKAVVEQDAPRPSSIRADYPQDLEKIVMKALSRAPAERWATAGELRAALEELARSWRFKLSGVLIARLMASAFSDEVAAWEQARAAGTPLSEHLAKVRSDEDEPSDPAGTDPEDGVAFEIRRAPVESSAPTQAPRAVEQAPWWQRHRRVLVGGLVAVAVVGVVAIVLAVIAGGSSSKAVAPAPGSSGSNAAPPIETIDLSKHAPAPAPDPAPPR